MKLSDRINAIVEGAGNPSSSLKKALEDLVFKNKWPDVLVALAELAKKKAREDKSGYGAAFSDAHGSLMKAARFVSSSVEEIGESLDFFEREPYDLVSKKMRELGSSLSYDLDYIANDSEKMVKAASESAEILSSEVSFLVAFAAQAEKVSDEWAKLQKRWKAASQMLAKVAKR